jgi:polyisoprenoid-binding protein YceI
MKQLGKLSVVAVMLFATAAFAETATWNIDTAHSAAQFTVRHMGISYVNGVFTKTSGTVQLDESDITKSSVDAVIDAASVDTRVEARDADLKSDHFFDVAKYPTLTFKSKKIAKNGDKLSVIGDLTIHGVTKEVTLESDGLTPAIKDSWGNSRRGFSATTKINRQDFGVKWQGTLATGELVVADEVKISLDIEMTKKK